MTKLSKSLFSVCIFSSSLRLHSKRSVNTDGLSVDHLVVDDVQAQLGELVRESESGRVGNFVRQIVAHLVGQLGQQRRVEQAWRNRAHSNTLKNMSKSIKLSLFISIATKVDL